MRKFRWSLLVLVPAMSLVVGISIAQAQIPAATTSPIKKPIPTYPSYPVTHKHVKSTSYVASCPSNTLPRQGVVKIGVPNSDPTYAYGSIAIGISHGQPYQILGGYMRSAPQQGIIAVKPISTDPCKDFMLQQGKTALQSSHVADVTTPTQDGALTITDVVGDTISYTIAGGKTGHFNYITHTFQP